MAKKKAPKPKPKPSSGQTPKTGRIEKGYRVPKPKPSKSK